MNQWRPLRVRPGSGTPAPGTRLGLPEDHVTAASEAVDIIVPLLRRGTLIRRELTRSDLSTDRRTAPGQIPIMIGAKGPKMLRLSSRHADI